MRDKKGKHVVYVLFRTKNLLKATSNDKGTTRVCSVTGVGAGEVMAME